MTGKNIVPLKIRKLAEQVFGGLTCGEVFHDAFHGITKAPDAGLSVTDLGSTVMRVNNSLVDIRELYTGFLPPPRLVRGKELP